MGDKDKKKSKKQDEKSKKSAHKTSMLTFLALLSGGALIAAFFLPLVEFDESVVEGLAEAQATFDEVYAEVKEDAGEDREDAEGDAEEEAELDRELVEEVVDEELGSLVQGQLTAIQMGEVDTLLKAVSDFVETPSGLRASQLLWLIGGKEPSSAVGLVSIPFISDVLASEFAARALLAVVLGIAVFGVWHPLAAWLMKFRRYNTMMLFLSFAPALALIAVIGMLTLVPIIPTDSPPAPDGTPVRATILDSDLVNPGLGGYALAIGAAGLLIVSLLGPRALGSKWSRPYLLYGAVVVAAIFGAVKFNTALEPLSAGDIPAVSPDADGD